MGNNSSHNKDDCNKSTKHAKHRITISAPTLQLDDGSSLSIPVLTCTPSIPSSTPMKHMTLTPFPSTASMESNRSYKSKLTHRTVSDGAAQLAAHFWQNNIEPLSMQQRLEIACALWFGMLSDGDTQTLEITRFKSFNSQHEMETTALKILDMLGFIVRAVYASNPNLSRMLQELGALHTKMGIKIEYYRVMLRYMHRILKSQCPLQYTEIVEFAMTQVFAYCAQSMTGQDIQMTTVLDDLSFLNSLRGCIRDAIGREYLFKYLTNVYCGEMVAFLHLLSIFKSEQNVRKRYMIAKQIAEHCISANGYFALNVSYDFRSKILEDMESMSKRDPIVCIDTDFFVDIEDQVCRLILQSHWKKFEMYMNEMYCIE